SVAYQVSTDGGTTWTSTSANQSSLADGTYQFHAVITDPAGNEIGRASSREVVDNTAHVAGTLSFANLTDTGSAYSPSITQHTTFNRGCSADICFTDLSVAYQVSTDGGTTWTSTSANQSSLADGTYQFHAVITDPAGN